MELTELTWEAKANKRWIEVTPSSGRGSTTVNVKILNNGPGFKGNIKFEYDGKTKNVEVTRCANYKNMYLTFKPSEDGEFKFSGNSVSYSLDEGQTWTTLSSNSYSPTIPSGSNIMWKAALNPGDYNTGIGTFSSTCKFKVEGNPLSLLYDDDFAEKTDFNGKENAFASLFKDCKKLIGAKNLILIVEELTCSCYRRMFQGCTSLTSDELPNLQATTLARECYNYMFSGCTSLTTIPDNYLPITTLEHACYADMFKGCTGITSVPINLLPATAMANLCYMDMFNGCKNLTTAPELPATTLANGCYSDMFKGCTSLTTPPELPATILADSCYQYMFRDCTSLTTAPILRAETLVNYCYDYMFQDCESLNNVICLAINITVTTIYKPTLGWLSGVASNGTFTKAASMTSWSSGDDGIPNGWTIINKED